MGNMNESVCDQNRHQQESGNTQAIRKFYKNEFWKFIWCIILVVYILGEFSNKCPGFCKCLIFKKAIFATFSNYAGHQKCSELSASDRRSMMNLSWH